jgi:hypothetical protein
MHFSSKDRRAWISKQALSLIFGAAISLDFRPTAIIIEIEAYTNTIYGGLPPGLMPGEEG